MSAVSMPLPTPPAYFNGFGIAGGATDITITLMNGNAFVGSVQAPPSVIKELCKALTDTVSQIESATGTDFKMLSELLELVSKKS